MDSSSSKPTKPTKPTTPPTPTDDEVISTSTESDTFDTWTLVTDKKEQQQRQQQQKSTHANDNAKRTQTSSGVEILKPKRNVGGAVHSAKYNDDNDNDEDSERHESLHEHDTSSIDGELSDGISIISESDGGGGGSGGNAKALGIADESGRISPHPFLREHLNDLTFKFSTGIGIDNLPRFDAATHLPSDNDLEDDEQRGEQQVRQRRTSRRSCTPQPRAKESALQPAEKSSSSSINALLPLLHMPPIVLRSLTCLFYGCVALVVLSFLGRLRHMAWHDSLSGVGGKPPMDELEAKLSDIELQNNLMRAEIDLLSKQVNYLSSQKDRAQLYQHYDKRHHANAHEETARKGKAFKAWLGNGKTMEAVDITKDDLHRPYKCADGQFVEVAGMCVDANVPNVATIVDEFGNVLDEALKATVFDAATEQQPTYDATPQQQQTADAIRAESLPHTRAQTTQTEASAKRPIGDAYAPSSSSRERRAYHESRQQRAEHPHPPKSRKQRDNSDEDDDDDDDDSKEHHKKRNYNSKEHKRHNNSKERRHHDHNDDDDDDSDEHHRNKQFKKPSYNSKERNRQQQNRRNSKEQYNNNGNGEWQEQRMRQRENARQQPQRDNVYTNNNNNKNWYIKRGDSREKIRGGSGERQQ